MQTKQQQNKAQALLSLHSGDELLILPNIWNPIGARILAAKGYPAVATASAAISTALGYLDGEKIERATMIEMIARIAHSVEVPVTADIEAGYGADIAELQETIRQVLDAGAVGINLEDSLVEGEPLRPVAEQCERIAAVRQVASKQGIPLVINARVDTFVTSALANKEERIADTVARAEAYAAAGADCIYPMGPGDRATLQTLRAAISTPLNVLVTPAAEPLQALQEIGINRVSFGPFILRSCLSKFAAIADELQGLGSYDCFTKSMFSREEAANFLREEPE